MVKKNDFTITREDSDTNNLHDDNDKIDFGTYKLPAKRNRADPPPFPEFTDKYKESDCLELYRQRDVAWVLIGFLGDKLYREMSIHERYITHGNV